MRLRLSSYKDFVPEEKILRWKEFYIPDPNHPYYGIRTNDHLKAAPSRLRVGAERYLEEALSGNNVSKNIRIVVQFRLQALYCEDLYQELLGEQT